MLNFDNLHKITAEMRNGAIHYTEEFFQRILNNLNRDKGGLLTSSSCEYPEHFNPSEIDPHDIFEGLHMEMECTYMGEFHIRMDGLFTFSKNFQLVSECLLNNGFTKISEEHFVHPDINHTNN